MSGPPCGELNEYLRAKYAAIRAAEAKAKAAATTDGFVDEKGLCMAVPAETMDDSADWTPGDIVIVPVPPKLTSIWPDGAPSDWNKWGRDMMRFMLAGGMYHYRTNQTECKKLPNLTDDELIGWWDYGSSISRAATKTFTTDFDATNVG